MLDELKLRYKEMPRKKRWLLCALLAPLPAIMVLMTEAVEVSDALDLAQQNETALAAKIIQIDNQIKNIEKTEEQLETTREQLKMAETRLPNRVLMDEVLREISQQAKNTNASVVYFEPQAEILKGDEYKYLEVPIKITVVASEYSQIGSWIDAVAGVKTKLYLKNWSMNRRILNPSSLSPDIRMPARQPSKHGEGSAQGKLNDPVAEASRDNLRVIFAGDFALYKLASNSEVKVQAALDEANQKQKENLGNKIKQAIGKTAPDNKSVPEDGT